MGCWNKTCGLSGLHIGAGADVYVFLLQENTNKSDRCYSTAFWVPLLLPFRSKYNDYGGGEESSGVAFPLIIKAIAEQLDEIEVGSNPCHDIAVKRDGFDEELFFESIHENRLTVRGKILDFVMFRKDVVDDILENWTQRIYVGNSTGNCGYDNDYRTLTFADVLADMPEFITRFAQQCQASDPLNHFHFLYSMSNGIGNIFEWGERNLVAKYLRNDGYRYCRILSVGEIVSDLIKSGKLDDATELITENLKGAFLDCFFDSTRKVWIPGAHEGSQSQDHDGYEALIGAIGRAIAAEKKRYEEDDD